MAASDVPAAGQQRPVVAAPLNERATGLIVAASRAPRARRRCSRATAVARHRQRRARLNPTRSAAARRFAAQRRPGCEQAARIAPAARRATSSASLRRRRRPLLGAAPDDGDRALPVGSATGSPASDGVSREGEARRADAPARRDASLEGRTPAREGAARCSPRRKSVTERATDYRHACAGLAARRHTSPPARGVVLSVLARLGPFRAANEQQSGMPKIGPFLQVGSPPGDSRKPP